MAKSTSTRRKQQRAKKKARLGFRGWLWRCIKWLLLLGLIVGTVWALRLDHVIRSKFTGDKWQLPAQVYASPLELYPGAQVNKAQLVSELQRLGYRPAARPNAPGQYVERSNSVELVSRAFRFWDGEQPSQPLRIAIRNGRIDGITHDRSGEALPILRLDAPLIGSIYPKHGEDRVLVRLRDIPPLLPAGLVAIEDKRFYQHFGIDPQGIARAVVANIKAGRMVQGGSTLTQQLVKNYFLNSDRNLWRKANEAVMAISLDFHYEKDEILEGYINEVFLGQDGERAVHGFGLGSYFWFRKPLSELRAPEIALLVGMVKGPSYYNPRRHPERAKARRNTILSVWHELGLLDEQAYREAESAPLNVVAKAGRGTSQYPAFVDLVKQQLLRDYQAEDLTSDGLRIFTTLDLGAQAAAEQTASKKLRELERARGIPEDTLETAMMLVAPDGGEVTALIGGRRAGYKGFNRVLSSRRPIGSLIKPFVYLTALQPENGYNVASPILDEAVILDMPNGSVWQPKNYKDEFRGSIPMYEALAWSINMPTVRTGLDVGVEQVAVLFRRLIGDATAEQVPAYPSMLLGAVNLSLMDVAQAYQPLAANGFRAPLNSIREVLTANGAPLRRYPLNVEQVVSSETVYLINYLLQRVVAEGTARRLGASFPNLGIAGKTGTSDDLRDSWFAGYTGNKLAVVWVGRDDNKPMGLTGSSGAAWLTGEWFADLPNQALSLLPPAGVEQAAVLSYNAQMRAMGSYSEVMLADGCRDSVALPFLRGKAPTVVASCRQQPRGLASPSSTAEQQQAEEEPERKGWFRRLFD